MRLLELFEARREPEKNTSEQGHTGALQFLKGLNSSDSGVNECLITMTNVAKVGMNPTSTFDTPLGIYVYPEKYYLDLKKAGKKLPFQDDARYIQILEMVDDPLYISNMKGPEFNQARARLQDLIPELARRTNKKTKEVQDIIIDAAKNAPVEAKVKTPGGLFWFITMVVSTELADSTTRSGKLASRASVLWNYILRSIGYSVIIDEGSGIIHMNEPTQGVILDMKAVRLIKTVENKADLKKAFSKVDDSIAIQGLLNLLIDKKSSEQQAEIIQEIVKKIKKDPSILNQLAITDVFLMAKLSSRPRIKNFILTEYIKQVWSWKKNSVDSILSYIDRLDKQVKAGKAEMTDSVTDLMRRKLNLELSKLGPLEEALKRLNPVPQELKPIVDSINKIRSSIPTA